ncbi:MAG: hypothetical protein AAF892_01665 [Cyanobacteria bacterium P01_D01_bin.71]
MVFADPPYLHSYGNPKLTVQSCLKNMKVIAIQIDTTNMTNLEPTTKPVVNRPKSGFTSYAEKLNGRAAMVGFVAIVAIEYFTGKGFLAWLGLV